MAALWPDTFVEEANLSFQISVLRRVLGTEAAQLLETVPKHGYRFAADVLAAPTSDDARAERSSGGQRSSEMLVAAKPTHVLLLAASVTGLACGRLFVDVQQLAPHHTSGVRSLRHAPDRVSGIRASPNALP